MLKVIDDIRSIQLSSNKEMIATVAFLITDMVLTCFSKKGKLCRVLCEFRRYNIPNMIDIVERNTPRDIHGGGRNSTPFGFQT